MTFDCIIVGGGAAGLWAAGTAAARGLRVVVVEKNKKAGVKILMSGGTRCNITHNCDISGIIKAFGEQGRFLKPALHSLSPDTVVQTVNELGVATKVESSGKVFPVSDRAIDVRDALVRRLSQAGAELRTGLAVQSILRSENPSEQWSVQTDNGELKSRKLILCCGGLSYSGCGTTGDGYPWSEALGHSLVDTSPALTPLNSDQDWVHELSGMTLPDVAAKVQIDMGEKAKKKDPRMTSRGGFLWTHFGCSGPVPMNLSRYISSLNGSGSARLSIDLIPDHDEVTLSQTLDAAKGGKRNVATVLQDFIPKNLAACLLSRANVSHTITLAELPKAARRSLIDQLKRLEVPINGTRGYPKAEVTRGGVNRKEVNPKTMESRIVQGLYFAGEILDVDGPIGGYNFQAAFSTGHTAALNL